MSSLSLLSLGEDILSNQLEKTCYPTNITYFKDTLKALFKAEEKIFRQKFKNTGIIGAMGVGTEIISYVIPFSVSVLGCLFFEGRIFGPNVFFSWACFW